MIKKKEIFSTVLILLIICFGIFWRSIFKGEYLFPGNYLVAIFSPYKSYASVPIANKPVADDVFRHIYTFKILAIDMIKHFQLPLWNPYNGAGMPLLATLNSGFFDPFNTLFLFLPYLDAWNMYLFLQFLLIGFFTYLYCRKINMSHEAGLFTSISFMFSGLIVARVTLGAYGLGIGMLPFLLFLIESYIKNYKRVLLFFISLSICVLIVSTHPQISLYIISFIFLYTAIRIFNEKIPVRKKIITGIYFFLSIIFGIGLAAIQIFPTVELIHYANLGADRSFVKNYIVPIYHFISLIIPNYFGNISTYNFWGTTDYVETVVAVGSIPCVFAYVGLIQQYSDREISFRKIFFLISIIVSCLFAVASPLTDNLFLFQIPLITTDPPSRIFVITTFCVVILAGYGFDHIISGKKSVVKLLTVLLPYILFLLTVLIITVCFSITKHSCRVTIFNCYTVALRNTLFEYIFFFSGLFILVTSRFINRKDNTLSALLIMFLVVVVGLYNAEKFLPFSPKKLILPKNQLIAKIISLSSGRTYGFGNAMITTNLATFFKLYDPQYYHPLYIKRYGELIGFANTGKYEQGVVRADALINYATTSSADQNFRRDRLLSLLGVRYLIYSKKEYDPRVNPLPLLWQDQVNYIVENKQAVPRISLFYKIERENNAQKILSTLFNRTFNPLTTVVLEGNPHYQYNNTPLHTNISLYAYTENSIRINSRTNVPTILVLDDNYYPGWNAYVDGHLTKIYRANYTFRSIILPAGNHHISFIYEPSSLKIGTIISGISFFLLVLLCFTRNREIDKIKI